MCVHIIIKNWHTHKHIYINAILFVFSNSFIYTRTLYIYNFISIKCTIFDLHFIYSLFSARPHRLAWSLAQNALCRSNKQFFAVVSCFRPLSVDYGGQKWQERQEQGNWRRGENKEMKGSWWFGREINAARRRYCQYEARKGNCFHSPLSTLLQFSSHQPHPDHRLTNPPATMPYTYNIDKSKL